MEADETYFGGKVKNMSHAKRKEHEGRGPVGKAAVTGIKDRASNQVRATVVQNTDAKTLQGFIVKHTEFDATVYTDDATTYASQPFAHETVKHSVSEFVRGQVHTNGIESFWSNLKRAHKGTFHKISPKHLDRYIQEFAGKHNLPESGTMAQMRATVAGLISHNLLWRDLIADNGLPSLSRS